jgi:hypothetical protein
MTLFGTGVAMFGSYFLLLWLARPHADDRPSLVGRNEPVASAYAVLLVALLVGGFALMFGALVAAA